VSAVPASAPHSEAAPAARAGWQAELRLRYWREGEHTRAKVQHTGPLRVLKALYPEGPGRCQHVIVHPPAGLVGGDELRLQAELGQGSDVLLSTPGATRFYRSEGAVATQQVQVRLAAEARLEWLPMETLIYPQARAENRLSFELQEGAEMIGWDLIALGLPASGQAFSSGCLLQALHLRAPGVDWLEQARIDAQDRVLLDSPVGLAGHRHVACLWWAAGVQAAGSGRVEQALEGARGLIGSSVLARRAAAGELQPGLVVVRALADGIEPMANLFRSIRSQWRSTLWARTAGVQRLWAT
jgi:urease accessory protein